MESRLKEIYTDPENPGGFAGINNLYNEIKKEFPSITRQNVQKFLEKQNTYTLHKMRRTHFKRETTVPAGLGTDVQVDLGFFEKLARHNKQNRYLLIAVDVLSRKIYLEAVKNKQFPEMKAAFERIFKRMPILPHRIFSDKGGEFQSKEIKKFFNDHEILKYHATFSTIKAAFAENHLKTVKGRLYRYMSNKSTLNWVDAIPKIENALNNTVCRSTKMTPNQVNFGNAQELWERLYGHLFKNKDPPGRFQKNNAVRISNIKGIFDKGYLPSYSDRIYKIAKIKKGIPITYELDDEDGQREKGKFYAEEFSKTHFDKDSLYRIEKVIRSRKLNGKKQFYVKFFGFKDRQWVDADTVV